MDINIPGKGLLKIQNLLLDYNGTIACDGKLIPGVKEKINAIDKEGITIHIVTADTHGTVQGECADMPVKIQVFDNENAGKNKQTIVESLGQVTCACIGNGFNDGLMFEASSLSIGVIGNEGASGHALTKADIVCKSIDDALELFLKPNRIVAGLRR